MKDLRDSPCNQEEDVEDEARKNYGGAVPEKKAFQSLIVLFCAPDTVFSLHR